MLKAETARFAGYVCAATLFSATALVFPFAAVAQDTAQNASLNTAPAAAAVPAAPVVTPATPAQTVTLIDGALPSRAMMTHGLTVSDALRDAGITLSHTDRVAPGLNTPLTEAPRIRVTRVRFTDQTLTQPIPCSAVFTMSRELPPGTVHVEHAGMPGVRTLTYRTGYVNGQKTSRWLVSSVVTRKPVARVTLGGIRVASAAALPSRGGTYDRMRALMMVATGYSPYEGSSTGRCATGMRAGYGVVAVDPRVIRLGTRLYISGYGYAVAGDTGGAIRGHRIDLGNATYREAAAVGRRRVQVWVLSPHH